MIRGIISSAAKFTRKADREWSLFFEKNNQLTKQDIAAQSDKIIALERKIDKLTTKLEALTAPLEKWLVASS